MAATVCDTSESFYKHWTEVTLRYGDTDRQGHVNNAVYCTLYESGRTAFLFDGEHAIAGTGYSFVIVKISLDYITEMRFPGIARVGSTILQTGRSSFTVGQAIFKDGVCSSTSNSVIVQIDDATGKSSQLTASTLAVLTRIAHAESA
ncbi:MAG: acyl-CoA thioesterase [Cyanobacteria bacterium]|nr:acyl-CoA thioesterase [Cyanobacteriota bacterium]